MWKILPHSRAQVKSCFHARRPRPLTRSGARSRVAEERSGVAEADLLAGPQLRHRVERGAARRSRSRGSRRSRGGRRAGSSAVRRRRPGSIPARSPRSRARPCARRSSAGPTSRAPMRSACSESRQRDSKSAARAASVNQSARGPGRSASVDRAGRRREGDVLVDDGHGCRGLRADLEHPARDHGVGSERRERVARPRAEHGGRLDAAAHREHVADAAARPCRSRAPRRRGPWPPCRAEPRARRG